jgi:hypothetical protein
MKTIMQIALSGAALILSASPAMAQTNIYETQDSETVTTGGKGRDGATVAGLMSKGSSKITWSDGHKTTETYSCIGVTQPPRDAIFMSHSVCDASGPDGNYFAIFGCNVIDAARNETSCVGGLYGKTGSFANRGGTITFHGVAGKGSGTAQWIK